MCSGSEEAVNPGWLCAPIDTQRTSNQISTVDVVRKRPEEGTVETGYKWRLALRDRVNLFTEADVKIVAKYMYIKVVSVLIEVQSYARSWY